MSDEHPNAALLRGFYEAFSQCDGPAMGAVYHDDATFSDPVFRGLDGKGAAAMWAMLTSRSTDLKVEFSGIEADDSRGKAHWEAWYTFTATGRKVHNIIDAEFTFRDGKVASHVDTFDFYRWTRMALGPMGVLLGWTPIIQNKIRKTAGGQLAKYRTKHGI